MKPSLLAVLISTMFALTLRAAEPTIEAAFEHPPVEAKPWTYWFWSDGNLTRAGITADLEAMKRVGIGGVLIMDVDQNVPKGPVTFMSPQWREMFAFAVAEAKRLGLKVNMNNDAGWTGSGGPWVDAEHSMQKVVWSETTVSGGQHFDGELPQSPATEIPATSSQPPAPPTSAAKPGSLQPSVFSLQPSPFYRDIAVLAFPTPSSDFRIDKFAAKSGLQLVSSPDSVAAQEKDANIDPARIVDLTSKMSHGRLAWDVPPGNWTIVRFGHTSTGKTNYPASAEGKGLEVDKLSREAVDLHFDAFIGKLIADTGGAKAADTLTTVHVDSWEVGYQNWTPKFREAFRRLRGYDPIPWLPTFTGRSVNSVALSERFLWDVRRTISELLNENYAARLAERAHENGRIFSVQAYRYGPFDCLSYAARADLPIGEFWTTRDPLNLHPSVKTMTSAGHIYGKNIIAAEAFTATDKLGRQRNHPYSLKAIGDAAFCAGVNQFIFHRYSMQPWVDDRKPGMTMGPWGVEYERTATWWEQTKSWHEYLARCQYLLRQGRFFADICYLQSEEGFNNPALPSEIKPPAPAGYDFDFCSDEIVKTRMSVENGRIVLADGMSYRVLVLPSQRLMTPELLRKIRELVRAGAIVYGAPPVDSPSLTGYPACDDEVKRLVAELWGDGKSSGTDNNDDAKIERTVGQGKVFWGVPLVDVLTKLGAEPDFAFRNSNSGDGEMGDAEKNDAKVSGAAKTDALPPIRFVHRTLSDRDVYFVSSLSDEPAHIVTSFRAEGGAPELWNAETGAKKLAAVYDLKNGRTQVPLDLDSRGSVFVVIRKTAAAAAATARIVDVKKDGVSLWETDAVPLHPKSAQGPAVAPMGSFTMAAWVKPAADTDLPTEVASGTSAYGVHRNDVLFPPPAHEVYGQRDAAGAGFAVGRNGVCVLEHGDHLFPATLVYPVEIHDWTHIAVVFDQGVPQLYLNGKLVRTGLKTSRTVYGGVGVTHGRDVEPFRGERSRLQQFDHALKAEEIAELMRTTPVVAEAIPRSSEAPPKAALETWPPIQIAESRDGKALASAWAFEAGKYELRRADRRVLRGEVDAVPAPIPIDGEWKLSFPAGWGAPPAVQLPALVSWTQHADSGVRYFSGTATYTKSFDVPADALSKSRRLWLDLGDVRVIAEVMLNGRNLGVLWKPPFRVEVTGALRAGSNALEVKVTNLWVNRLIGDEQLPADREWMKVPNRGGFALKAYPDWFLRGERSPVGRVTFATWKHYEKDASLLPSGLLGPVALRTEVKVELEKN
ncbi:MAG TPA: glycosyl hydrolase [Opitutaceae bacterium]|nr:glycosyl hydrolase [Opitutaceae bacterium]